MELIVGEARPRASHTASRIDRQRCGDKVAVTYIEAEVYRALPGVRVGDKADRATHIVEGVTDGRRAAGTINKSAGLHQPGARAGLRYITILVYVKDSAISSIVDLEI
jgi:hypothetical protein